ncbi:MAG TPA: orotidine-5'-phosphate decarboxylase [Bacteroidetes bacterium]|nr:orotidine-5'-phosphate decarboxylase [Bacteroidota bacterium]
MKFTDKLKTKVKSDSSVLCVGLDPDPSRIPDFILHRHDDINDAILDLCTIVIDESSDHCVAFKPNLAFFEALGTKGIEVFEKLCAYIPQQHIIIADAKRGDIGNTASKYRQAFFDTWKCDSVTLSPLMGIETITPFLTDERFGIFVLTLTSNPGATEFLMRPFEGYDMMAEFIADKLSKLNQSFPGHAGMVVGATHTEVLPNILRHYPDATLLIPGVGSQGGDIQILADALRGHAGIPLVNVSRGIMYGAVPAATEESELRSNIRNRAKSFQQSLLPITNNYLSNVN